SPDLVKLFPTDTQAEALLEHALNLREVYPVDDMQVHSPTLQPVQVLVSSAESFGRKPCLAVLAPMPGGLAENHSSVHAAPRELQVIGELAVSLLAEPGDPCSLAEGAGAVRDLHRTGGLGPRQPLAEMRACPPDHLARAEEDLLPLIVEVGTLVDAV